MAQKEEPDFRPFASEGYYQDATWLAVDDYTIGHLSPSTRPYHSGLSHALRNTASSGLPEISAHPSQAKAMALQCRAAGVTRALEVGTLGGYAAIWLAALNPGMRVTTVEYDARHAEVARRNFREAGVEGQVELIVGAGMDVLPRLLEEVREGKRERFGFTFVDADKENNYNYFDLAVQMSYKGATVIVDNVVFNGAVVSEDESIRNRPNVIGARDVIEAVGRDKRVEACVMQTVAQKSYDGYLMAVIL